MLRQLSLELWRVIHFVFCLAEAKVECFYSTLAARAFHSHPKVYVHSCSLNLSLFPPGFPLSVLPNQQTIFICFAKLGVFLPTFPVPLSGGFFQHARVRIWLFALCCTLIVLFAFFAEGKIIKLKIFNNLLKISKFASNFNCIFLLPINLVRHLKNFPLEVWIYDYA